MSDHTSLDMVQTVTKTVPLSSCIFSVQAKGEYTMDFTYFKTFVQSPNIYKDSRCPTCKYCCVVTCS